MLPGEPEPAAEIFSADKDHVFLDFQAKHTSLTVWNMFKGFSGFVQADAHAIYDALFKGVPRAAADPTVGGHPDLRSL